jgi:hypothetical protein
MLILGMPRSGTTFDRAQADSRQAHRVADSGPPCPDRVLGRSRSGYVRRDNDGSPSSIASGFSEDDKGRVAESTRECVEGR